MTVEGECVARARDWRDATRLMSRREITCRVWDARSLGQRRGARTLELTHPRPYLGAFHSVLVTKLELL